MNGRENLFILFSNQWHFYYDHKKVEGSDSYVHLTWDFDKNRFSISPYLGSGSTPNHYYPALPIMRNMIIGLFEWTWEI